MRLQKIVLSLLVLVALFGFSGFVFASPTVDVFTSSAYSVTAGQIFSLTWSSQTASSFNMLAVCTPGVKIQKDDGSIYPCDSKNPTTNQSGDSAGFILINTSGSYRYVTFKLFPKDSNGTEYSPSKDITIGVSALPYPLSDLFASATSTVSGVPVTVTWTSQYLDGVNMILSCVDGVTASSSTLTPGAILQCGKNAFDTKLPGSGSADLWFKNKNIDRATVNLTVLPYISDNTYDLSHSKSLTLDIASDRTLPGQILSFVPSQPQITSDDSFTLIWTTKYATGVNIKMACDDSLTLSIVTSTTTTPIACGALLSSAYLAPNGSITVAISNSSNQIKQANLSLYSQLQDGGFDGINASRIVVNVNPKGQPVIFTGVSTSTLSTSGTTKYNMIDSVIISPRRKITTLLKFGSRGDSVSALQEFLSKNGYYPEGLVTGYFGRATEKAVQRFQEAYGIAKSGQVGYGTMGPMTRTKFNSF